MAYPSLIQKIYDMRQEVLDTQYVEAEQARQFVILADRLTKIELALIRGGIPTRVSSISGAGGAGGSGEGFDGDCPCSQYLEVDHACQVTDIADRLTKVELSLIRGGSPSHGDGVDADCLCTPAGYEVHKGARVAPLTIVSEGSSPVPGAAVTAIVSDLESE